MEHLSVSLAASKLVDETRLRTCYTLTNQIWKKEINSLQSCLFTCMTKQLSNQDSSQYKISVQNNKMSFKFPEIINFFFPNRKYTA